MLTVVGIRSGYCAIGSTFMASAPASVIIMEMTLDNIGRLIKILGLTDAAIQIHLTGLLSFRGGFPVFGSVRIVVAHSRAVAGLEHAVNNNALAAFEPALKEIILSNAG